MASIEWASRAELTAWRTPAPQWALLLKIIEKLIIIYIKLSGWVQSHMFRDRGNLNWTPLWHKAQVFWANTLTEVRGEETESNQPQTPVWSARQNTLPFIKSNMQTIFTKGSMALGSTEKAIYWLVSVKECMNEVPETLLYCASCVRKSSKSQCLLRQQKNEGRPAQDKDTVNTDLAMSSYIWERLDSLPVRVQVKPISLTQICWGRVSGKEPLYLKWYKFCTWLK